MPTYTLADVSRYLRVPRSTLAAWGRQRGAMLTFRDLVDAFLLTSLTRAVRISLPRAREAVVNVSKRGQTAIHGAVESALRRVDFDPDHQPVRFSPWQDRSDEPRAIEVDPRRAFGRPTVAGRSLKVDTVIDLLEAGETVAAIARNYELEPSLVRAVGRWGESAQAAG